MLGRAISSAEIAANPSLKGAFAALSEARSATFNEAIAADRRIYYQSWAGLSNVAGIPNPKDR